MTLVVEHHEELEIDLLRQDVDLLDFWRGRITPRRLQLLLDHLPASSLAIAKTDPETALAESWTTTDYLVALLCDLTGYAHAGTKWQPVTRPVEGFREQLKQQDIARLLAEQAERNAQRERGEAAAARTADRARRPKKRT